MKPGGRGQGGQKKPRPWPYVTGQFTRFLSERTLQKPRGDSFKEALAEDLGGFCGLILLKVKHGCLALSERFDRRLQRHGRQRTVETRKTHAARIRIVGQEITTRTHSSIPGFALLGRVLKKLLMKTKKAPLRCTPS